MEARHVTISGRVQGVGYRAFVAQQAERLGLSGWVRNRADGSVEAVFSGDAATVSAMIGHCRNGPAGSQVDAIVQAPGPSPEGVGFTVRPTL